MKVWMKLSLLCMAIYILILGTAGIVMIEKNYSAALTKEIDSSFREEKSAQTIVNTYLSMEIDGMPTNIKNSADVHAMETNTRTKINNKILSTFKSKNTWVQLFDNKKKIIVSSLPYRWNFKRDELDRALIGDKNYVLREKDGKRYLFITDVIEDGNIISMIRDVSYIVEQKNEQYFFFIRLAFVGLILLSIITPFMSRYITVPIEKLSDSMKTIIKGNYNDRVEVSGKDEIGKLAIQFNTMVSEIESRITELAVQGERKQRFIDDLIHELRTPLTSIIGYSDFLLNNAYDKGLLCKSLTNINSEGKRLLESANKLMELVLLNSGEAVCLEKTDIRELLEEIASDMKPKLDSKEIKINIETEYIYMPIDRDLIKSVITNLIVNSIRACERGSTITVGNGIDGERRCIFVRDEGVGIPEDELGKIFEPFYRVDRSRSRKDGGAGLGLSISNEIVKAHGAQLKFESKMGKGTTAEVIF